MELSSKLANEPEVAQPNDTIEKERQKDTSFCASDFYVFKLRQGIQLTGKMEWIACSSHDPFLDYHIDAYALQQNQE